MRKHAQPHLKWDKTNLMAIWYHFLYWKKWKPLISNEINENQWKPFPIWVGEGVGRLPRWLAAGLRMLHSFGRQFAATHQNSKPRAFEPESLSKHPVDTPGWIQGMCKGITAMRLSRQRETDSRVAPCPSPPSGHWLCAPHPLSVVGTVTCV